MLSTWISGTSGADTFAVAPDSGSGGVAVTVNGGTPMIVGPSEALGLDTLDAPEGQSDSITIAADLLNPLDLIIAGGSGSRSLTINGGTVNLDLIPRGGAVSVVMNGGVVNLQSTQRLGDLDLNGTSRLNLPEGRFKALILDGLDIATNATLDVNDNALIVNYPSGQGATVLAGVTAWLITGINASSGWWDGPGIASTSAHNAGGPTDLGVMNNVYGGQPWCSSFMGQPVGANAILVRYTYDGDADLSGVINSADYARIDNGFANDLSGWANGDFNFDGVVNANDYFEIDRTYRLQAHAPAVSIAGNPSVNEGSQYDLSLNATTQGVAAISAWTAYWGDGAVDTATAQSSGQTPASHIYGDNGTYTFAAFAKGPQVYYVATGTVQVNAVDPHIPTGLATDWISAFGVGLSWDSPRQADAVTGFVLQVSDDNNTFVALTTAAGDETWAWADYAFAPNTTYYFRFAAQNALGQSGWSTPSVSATTGSTPAAPTDLSVSAITSGSAAAMSWADNADNEDGFIVQWPTTTSFDDPAGYDYAPANAGTGTVSFTAAGPFAPGTSYYFRVLAYNDYSASDPSNTYGPVTTLGYPDAPSDLAAIAVSSTEIDLTWTNNATNATGLYLQRSTDGSTWGSAASLSTSATTYDDGSLTPDTVYYYRLYATNAAGQSAYASIDRATPGDAPDAPTVAPASAWHIDLSWTALTWTNLGGYRVYRGTADTFTPDQDHLIADGVTGNEYADTSVEPDGVYYYKVTAVTTYGDESAPSDASDEADALAAPTITGDSTADEGDQYEITLTLNGNTIDTWDLDWGDGAFDADLGAATSAQHAFMGSISSADIAAYVYDADGMHELTGPSVTISDLAPTVSISGDSSVNEGAVYTLTLSATDPGDDPITHWVIDWGAGGYPQTIWGNPSSITHIYPHHSTSSLTISATAFDANGAQSSADTQSVTVDDVATTVTITGAATFETTLPYFLDVTSSDPDPSEIAAVTVYWGDGNSNAVWNGNGLLSHYYYGDGPYTITFDGPVTISDKVVSLASPAPHLYWFWFQQSTQLYDSGGLDIKSAVSPDNYTVNTTFGDYRTNGYISVTPTVSAVADRVLGLIEGSVTINSDWLCPTGHTWDFPDDANTDDSEPFRVVITSDPISPGSSISGHIDLRRHQDCPEGPSDYYTGWSFTFYPLNVSINANGSAREGASDSGRFGVWRLVGGPPVVVPFALGGSAVEGEDFTAIQHSVSFTTWNQTYATSDPIAAIDDTTPEWTDSVIATLGASSGIYITGDDRAVITIGDNDIGISGIPDGLLWANTDDDDENGVPDCEDYSAAGDDDLIPITLDFPAEERPARRSRSR